jgi:hypothetical protein
LTANWNEFKKRTNIDTAPTKPGQPNWDAWLAFQRDLFVEHVTKYANAVHAKNPKVMVCSNWMYSVRQPEPMVAPVDYVSGDFDPSFGADRACAEARFIASRGKPWDLMAWSFLRTGNQGHTTKPVAQLCQELSVVLAQGGAVFIYDQPQRSGRLTSWHQDILAQVAAFCRKRKDLCHKTATIPQVAVLHSQTFYYRHNDPLFNFASANQPMEGALHAALENGFSVDILNEDALLARMNEYPVVIVPEQEALPQKVADALRAYVQTGGHLMLSGAEVAAQYADLAGAAPAEGEVQSGWVAADNGCVAAAGPWQKIKITSAIEFAPLLNGQEPALNLAGTPAATVNRVGQGVVVAVHGPVFRDYYQGHYPLLRRFIGDCLNALDASKLICVDGPWWIEMSARKKDGRMLIQFVNRSCSGYTSPSRHVVENVPDAGPFTVKIPIEAKPKRCYMAPDETGLEWTWKDGILSAHVAGLRIHNTLVIE